MRNRVQLIGNLGQDPEVKSLENGQKMVRLSLATNENYKNKNGEKSTDTQWHNIVAFGAIVEVIEKYLKKGSEVAIEGRLKYKNYEDKEGVKHYGVDIILSDLQMLGSK